MANTEKTAPHQAIVTMMINVHEVEKTGECSPRQMSKEELAELGIMASLIPVVVKGKNKYDCIKRLHQKIREFHDGD